MKRLRHSERAHEGFKSEDDTAKSLKRKGHSVKQNSRNAKNDMNVDGKRVEVKAAVETSYKGSDGYPIRGFVFSNMKKQPNTDKYILKCMSPDRERVIKQYEIPANKVKQRTLTITRTGGKYDSFLKSAHEQPYGYDDPQGQYAGSRLKSKLRRAAYESAGSVVGALAGVGVPTTLAMFSGISGESSLQAPVTFKNVLGLTAGSLIGRRVGKAMADASENDRTPRSTVW